MKLKSLKTYNEFKKNVRNQIFIAIKASRIEKEEKTIVGYGATSKSTTIFNYSGIGSN